MSDRNTFFLNTVAKVRKNNDLCTEKNCTLIFSHYLCCMKRYSFISDGYAWLWNILGVFVAYTLCRLVFLIVNMSAYAGMSFSHTLHLFAAGLIFDTSAILYTNSLIILMFLFPLHYKEKKWFYSISQLIYAVVNTICVSANLIDCVYYQFTGRRTTLSVFSEFSNESLGSMLKILGEQLVANWYLLFLVVIAVAFWKLFRRPVCIPVTHKSGYYIFNGFLLVIVLPLCVAGMRGGFTTATRPITISNANQYVNKASETGIVLNTPFAIIRSINKTPFITPDYMSQQEVDDLFSPVHLPADSVRFRPMNVVVMILESFSKQHFGFYNKTLHGGTFKGFTPFLDSLITRHALTWQYSYANGRKSIEGMPSVLSSLPNYVEPLFLTPASLNDMSGLARELSQHKGYTSAFFHGAQNGSMGFEAFARATGFQRYYGRTEYNKDPHYHGDKDFDGTWAIFDEEFLQFYCDRMSEMEQPFMTAVFTAASHTPYPMPERYKGKFPKGEDPIQECIAYSDNAIRLFFEKASHQKWFKNTLFVITSDHTSRHYDKFYTTTLGHSSVPIILYVPSDTLLHGYDTCRVVQQIDIMPTILNYIGYDQPYIAFGQDMINTPPSKTSAMHWVPETSSYEFVKGNYVIDFDGNRVTHAFRYRTDSLLLHNVVHTMPSDTLRQLERQMKAMIQSYMYRMNTNQLTIASQK